MIKTINMETNEEIKNISVIYNFNINDVLCSIKSGVEQDTRFKITLITGKEYKIQKLNGKYKRY